MLRKRNLLHIQKHNTMLKQKIGIEIKNKREHNKLTQKQLANEIGINHSVISRIESGKWLSIEMLEKICNKLNIVVSLK